MSRKRDSCVKCRNASREERKQVRRIGNAQKQSECTEKERERRRRGEMEKKKKKKGKRTLKTTHMYTKESREDDIC